MKEEVREERKNWREQLSRGQQRAKCLPVVRGSKAHPMNREVQRRGTGSAGRTSGLSKGRPELLGGANKLIVKHLKQCLTHSKHYRRVYLNIDK